jgi:hypothetical protein
VRRRRIGGSGGRIWFGWCRRQGLGLGQQAEEDARGGGEECGGTLAYGPLFLFYVRGEPAGPDP